MPEPRRLSATKRARRQLAFAAGLLLHTLALGRGRKDGQGVTDLRESGTHALSDPIVIYRLSLFGFRSRFAASPRLQVHLHVDVTCFPLLSAIVALFWYRSLSNLVSI